MNEIKLFSNKELGFSARTMLNEDGSISINAEDAARGFGWTQTQNKNGKQYTSIRWETLNSYCEEFGFPNLLGKDDYIPESLFYRLGMKASNKAADKFQNWLAMEVIPSIRKHGIYATDNVIDNILSNPDFGIKLLTELKEERTKRAECEQKIKQQEAEIIHKEDVIIGLVDDISLAEKRQILNRVVRYNHANYQKRWQLLYLEFESKYHIDLQKRLDNYNADHKPKCKSKLDYIDRVMGKVPELYEIATKLFESDVKALVDEMYLAIIA